jgi:hypothetical protein
MKRLIQKITKIIVMANKMTFYRFNEFNLHMFTINLFLSKIMILFFGKI